MNKFIPYLNEIGIDTNALLAQLVILYNICSEFCPEEIETLFMSEYRNSDNSIVYESMFLLSKSYLMEVKQPFEDKVDWDIVNYTNKFEWIKFDSTAYDYKKAKKSSRLIVTCESYNTEVNNIFKASSSNCNYLWKLTNECIKPNILVSK